MGEVLSLQQIKYVSVELNEPTCFFPSGMWMAGCDSAVHRSTYAGTQEQDGHRYTYANMYGVYL